MVKETNVIKLSSIMMNLYKVYPDLKSWNYKVLYRRDNEGFSDDSERKRWLGLRAKEIERTTQAICSFLDMGFCDSSDNPESYLKSLIKYYLVLMDAGKCNLNYQMASDDIFENYYMPETVEAS